MSSTMDPSKMKVVDLRNELASRGLDTKGNKAALVKRLKDALELETDQILPDSSILETSTEDLDTSQQEEVPVKDASSTKKIQEPSTPPEKSKSLVEVNPKTEQKTPEKPKAEKSPDKPSVTKPEIKNPTKGEVKPEAKTISPVKVKPTELSQKDAPKVEANGEAQMDLSEGIKEPAKKGQQTEGDATTKMEEVTEKKGEKRKREGNSPQRSQRRRSRSPIKEDEPEINPDNVQLNWYDSDLHLQVDKETFLSAKPLTEGAFGYAWAGVRATHGVSSGKVCYEIKITEELKWEDFSKPPDRSRHDSRRNYRDRRDRGKRDSERTKTAKGKAEKESKGEGKAEKESKGEEKAEKESKGEEKAEKGSKGEEKAEKESKGEEKGEKESKLEEKKEKESKGDEKAEKENKAETKTGKETKIEEEGDAEATEGKKGEEKMDTSTPTAEVTPMETEDAEKSEKTEEPTEKKDDEKDKKESDVDKRKEKSKEETEPIPTHLFRVGWSQLSNSLQLGEEEFSYGYESTGKFVTNKAFVEYGKKFGVGDVIGAYLDIDNEIVTIQYTLNGEVLPVATTIPKSELPQDNFALFPHVLTRNYVFELNLGNREEPWFPIPEEFENYVFLNKADEKVAGPLRPETRAECEVILMCGLPASGKTHWVNEHVGANIDKRYTVLGNTSFLEKMTVSGEPIKSKFKGKWSILIDRIQKCLNRLISMASLRRRNYIIDQTNVFPSAQRRKMRPFEGFKRKAVIIVVGDEEQARRHSLQEAVDGKGVPDSTMLEMKASMSIPEKCDWMEEVMFAELEEAEAKAQVKKYNAAGKEAGYSPDRRFRDRWQNRRNDFRGRNNRNRSYQNQRHDSRGSRWQQQRVQSGSSGGWNRDRRDSRGPQSRNWRGSQSSGYDSRSQVGQYNRNQRDQGGRWSSSGAWGSGGQSGGWNQQTFGGSGGYGNWGSGNWKYGSSGSQGYGGGGGYGGGSWNYYGQYAQGQNWGQKK